MRLQKNLRFLGNRQNIIIVILSITLSFFIFYFLFFKTSAGIYVVDNQKMFEAFRMTKEAKIKGEQLLKAQKIKIDSLNVQLALEQNELLKSQLYNQIISQKEEMQYFNENYTQEETSKIWKRIEGYMVDFAKLNGYDLIIGSQGTGDVWYTTPKKDVTEEALNYINKKYEGFN